MDHPIMLSGQAVGKVSVTREGLYYRFRCQCRFEGGIMYRIMAKRGGRTEKLGIPVPVHGGYELDTRLPVKRFGEGTWCFAAEPIRPEQRGQFVPLKPEEPFRYLRRLQDASLMRRDGVLGVILPEESDGCDSMR